MERILIAGATGNLGPHLVKELTNQGHQVTVLLRSETLKNPEKLQPLQKAGVSIIEGDLGDYQALEKACANQDIVISAVGGGQIMQQVDLAKAAKQAGVKRFIPSEFGVDPFAAGDGACDLFDAKAGAQKQIKKVGIPMTPIYTNGFMEFWGTGLGQLGAMSPPDEVQLYENGMTDAFMVSLTDIARYTNAIINDANTMDKEVSIRANRINQNDLITTWENISGKKVKRIPVSEDQLNEIIDNSTTPETIMQRIFTQLHRSVWVKGDCIIERPGVLSATELYPNINPVKLPDFLSHFK
jgi:uncharacterized protein YbjT (DUF2867 family)